MIFNTKVELGEHIHQLVKAGYLIGDWKTRDMKNGKMKATKMKDKTKEELEAKIVELEELLAKANLGNVVTIYSNRRQEND